MIKINVKRVLILGYVLGIIILTIRESFAVGLGFLSFPLIFLLCRKYLVNEMTDWKDKVNMFLIFVLFRVIATACLYPISAVIYLPDMGNMPIHGAFVSLYHIFSLDAGHFDLSYITLLLVLIPSSLVEAALLVFPRLNQEIYGTTLRQILASGLVLLGLFVVNYILYYIHYLCIFIFYSGIVKYVL